MNKLLVITLLLASCHPGGQKTGEADVVNTLCPPVTYVAGCEGNCGYSFTTDAHAVLYDCRGAVVTIHGAMASSIFRTYKPGSVIIKLP